jgi:hypothetical protein
VLAAGAQVVSRLGLSKHQVRDRGCWISWAPFAHCLSLHCLCVCLRGWGLGVGGGGGMHGGVRPGAQQASGAQG